MQNEKHKFKSAGRQEKSGEKSLTSVIKIGTYISNMVTTPSTSPIAAALFGRTRRTILALLFTNPDKTFYLRQLVRVTGLGLGAVQRELPKLCEAEIILRTVVGRQVFFQANPRCPVFSELKSMMIKTLGLADVLKAALTSLADRISSAFIYGSIARGEEKPESDVDLLVVGKIAFSEVVSALRPAQEALAREVNPTVYPPKEFATKVSSANHFLKNVLSGPRIFLIGDDRELARLAKKRLAD